MCCTAMSGLAQWSAHCYCKELVETNICRIHTEHTDGGTVFEEEENAEETIQKE